MKFRKIKQPRSKPFQPMGIGTRQRQGERRPGWCRAHCGEVAQIHGKRAMAYRARIGTVGEMPPSHHSINGGHQIRPPWKLKQRRIIANSENDARLAARRRGPREKAPYQFEFAEVGWLQTTSYCAGRPYSCGRNSCAARSSTAFTNLWPSVAPNCLVSCTASASATRYGNSARYSSSCSPSHKI